MVVDSKLMLEVKAILKDFGDKYFDGDTLKRHKVTEDLNAYNEGLIQSLLNNETINRDFVISVNGKEIFKLNEFIDMFQYKEFWQDSYTNYANKIGLTVGGKFIDECEDVVLNFPYKDTILKAGMSKEDKQKEDIAPNEMFLNETIAKDEIDVLFDKKIFKNVKKYHSEGIQPVKEFKEDDNLIIKGNNLIALHTLRNKYAGKVKLIYIDPPYNTGNDSFLYNDKYNHSSWLTFMKNRLEIALELLSDDGSIWVTLDDKEAPYARVLMDSVFNRKNYVTAVTWQHSDNSNNNALVFSEDYNTILVYSKCNNWKPKFLNDESKRSHFKNPDNNPRGPWFDGNPVNNPGLRVNLQFDITTPNGNIIKHPTNGWRWSKETMQEKFQSGELRFSEDQTRVIRRTYLNEMEGLPPSNLWTDLKKTGHTRAAKYEQKKLFPDFVTTSLFSTPKPELLLNYIFELSTNENDIVLDFFMGSATTQSVAMKMNRHFIGIEQMDYINEFSVPRLQKVIEGEQGGISKDVNWQGGGSFIYAELFEKNTGFIKEILNAETTEDLKKTYANMIFTSDLDFRADLSKIDWAMPFEDNQKLLIKIIDKNQLYFNYSEIDDNEVNEWLTDEEVAFNKNFYGDLEE
jgi:adenine-specific DNA-methyltransferase